MDKFWVTELEGGFIFEVEISGWILFPRRQLTRALLQIQERREGLRISSVHRFPGMWNHHFLVFTH